MKKSVVLCTLVIVLTLWFAMNHRSIAADGSGFQTQEFVTIRWDGKENTHLIRANGKVEPLGPILAKVPCPNRVNVRAFYMNIAMNAVAREGYEFAGMTNDEIVMKRTIAR